MNKFIKTAFKSRLVRASLMAVSVALFIFLYQTNNESVTKISSEDIAAGSVIANQSIDSMPACTRCHGNQGQGDLKAGIPRLAGLHPDYIFKQLEDFARNPLNTRVALDPIARDYNRTPRLFVDLTVFTPGTRAFPVMNRIARSLSRQEKRQLASYFSVLSFEAIPVASDFETLQRGEDLALRGKPEYGVPACISCHGKKLQGIDDLFPPLAGQPPKYIVDQINSWQRGRRDNDHQALMRNVANQLTDGDKANIAAYIANLSYKVNVN